jgi:iron complex outermembrane recepter protein
MNSSSAFKSDSKKKIITLAVIAAISASIPPTFVWAQTSTTPAAGKKVDGDSEKLETVTVTAQRREQELQSVPLPVSTFTAKELESRSVTNTLKLAEYIPNMFASNNTGLGTANQYFLRGLGNTETIATFDPPVGTYVNDVYVSRQNANNFGFFDVERIEVLRGPQGTLFGRNTTGGAINIILKKPSAKLGGYFEIGGGSYSEFSSRGSVDVPIDQDFRTKFSYYVKKDKGYANNITTGERNNDQDNVGLRGAFGWRINNLLSWDLAIDNIVDQGASIYNARVGNDRITRTGLRSDYAGFFTAAGVPRITGSKVGYGLGNRVANTSVTSNFNLTLDGVSIDFITGYRDLTQKYALDFGNTPVASGGFTIVNYGEHKQFTQEIKAAGELTTVPLSYVAGLFYMDEDNRTDFADVFNTSFSGAPLPGTTLVLADRILKNKTKSNAIYAQGDYKLGSQLTATVGLRFTDDTKSINFSDNRAAPAASQLSDANITAAGIPLSVGTKLSTPRFALAYQLNKDTMFFGSATRGFKSGGWNARGTSAALLQPFEPEKIWSYEAGWRASFANNSIRFNGTLFKSDTKQLQTPSAFVAPSGAVSFITRNFADLSNQGIELELTAAPTRGLTTYINAGFQDAKYTNIAQSIVQQQAACRASIAANAATRPSCLNGIVTASGEIADPVRSPKNSVSGGATYVFPVGAGLRLSTSGNLAYSSRTSVGTANNQFAEAHTSVNAAVALLSGDDAWRVTLDCSNCTNKTWFTASLAGLSYTNDPRRYGLKFNYVFK